MILIFLYPGRRLRLAPGYRALAPTRAARGMVFGPTLRFACVGLFALRAFCLFEAA